jgi:uncharacterized membrane protein
MATVAPDQLQPHAVASQGRSPAIIRAAVAGIAVATLGAAVIAAGMGMLALRVLHVGSAALLVGGIVGRDVALGRASRQREIGAVSGLVRKAGRFEAILVRPGSFVIALAGVAMMVAQGRPLVAPGTYWLTLSIVLFLTSIPMIAFVFIPRGRRFEAAMAESQRVGAPTPQLAAAFGDRAVAMARRFELVVIAAIAFLMIVKPF